MLAGERRPCTDMNTYRIMQAPHSQIERSPGAGRWIFLLAVAAAACGESTGRGAKTPADQAAFMERTRCAADDDDKALAPVLSGDAVQGVHPLYSTVEGA